MAKAKPITAEALQARANGLHRIGGPKSWITLHPLRAQIIECVKRGVRAPALSRALKEEGYEVSVFQIKRLRYLLREGKV